MATEQSPMGTHRAGVVWHSGMCKWQARIKRNGEVHHLGTFLTEAEAIAARDAAEIAMDGRVGGKMVRSAFDEVVAEMHPVPGERRAPVTGMLPKLPATPTPTCTVTPEELFAFIHRTMTLWGSLVLWKGDERRAVHHLWGKDCESLLSFKVKGERQVVRHADVAWQLVHQRPIPAGHTVRHSDGDVTHRAKENLWLVSTAPY